MRAGKTSYMVVKVGEQAAQAASATGREAAAAEAAAAKKTSPSPLSLLPRLLGSKSTDP